MNIPVNVQQKMPHSWEEQELVQVLRCTSLVICLNPPQKISFSQMRQINNRSLTMLLTRELENVGCVMVSAKQDADVLIYSTNNCSINPNQKYSFSG